MRIHPTRSTCHVAVAGASLVALGAAARLAPAVAFGGAMLLAVALGRAMARVEVARLRAAGFEMAWTGAARVRHACRGGTLVVQAELRNRGPRALRAVGLRAVASSMLEVEVEPKVIDLPPGARACVDVAVRTPRVGRWGVHGLALEMRGTPLGGEGLYEVPLLFSSPLGIEVLPPSLAAVLASPLGGRSRRARELGRRARFSGPGDELRELRDLAPGDAFKRIAWKASARRGRLLVRETEPEEPEVLWMVLDASVEMWAGTPGQAPLDRVVDQVAARATRHLRRGDRVGLVVFASRVRSWISPEPGAAHAAAIGAALASAASCIDADRSELDERAVAQRVVDHVRPLDPDALDGRPPACDLDALASRADRLRERAPFAPRVPYASTARERSLRHYLAAFGIESPPRSGGEREQAETTIGQVLARLALDESRASAVHIWAPPPAKTEAIVRAIGAIRRKRIDLRWTLPPFEAGVGTGRDRHDAVADSVDDAVRVRAKATRARGERLLRRLGVRFVERTAREGSL